MKVARFTLVMLAACGSFAEPHYGQVDAHGNGHDDSADAKTTVNCLSLPATCGRDGSSPCCDSLIVPEGDIFRSYDAGSDGYNSYTGYPAKVSRFRLDKYEVTVARFRQFVDAGFGTQQQPPGAGAAARALNGAAYQGGWETAWNRYLAEDRAALSRALLCDTGHETWTDAPGSNESLPINCITWYEAMAFCAADGGFLPTFAEWENAAGGGVSQRAYPWSDPASSLMIDCSYANFDANCGGQILPPGSKSAKGNGSYGHSDLSGNVAEWGLDFEASMLPVPCTDCANLTPDTLGSRTLNGGSFSRGAPMLRTGQYFAGTDLERKASNGVRCARKAQ